MALQIAVKGSALARGRENGSIIAALSELAAEVPRRRTVDEVLATSGEGILRLGMRLYAFEVSADELVLRYLATARSRLIAIERRIGRPLSAASAAVPLSAFGMDSPLAKIDRQRQLPEVSTAVCAA